MLVQIIVSSECRGWEGNSVDVEETDKTLVGFVCDWIRKEFYDDEDEVKSDEEILEDFDEYLGLYTKEKSIDFDQSENEFQVTFRDFSQHVSDEERELYKKYL
jgi:hypothetical protein